MTDHIKYLKIEYEPAHIQNTIRFVIKVLTYDDVFTIHHILEPDDFESNFDRIMEHAKYSIRKLMKDRKKALAEEKGGE